MSSLLYDAHAHCFGHEFFRTLLNQRPGRPPATDEEVFQAVKTLGLEPPPKEPEALAHRWAAELGRHGVARMALMASVPNDWDSVARMCEARPDRFVGYLMANPLSDATPAILDAALESGQLKAVCFFPAMHRFHVYDPAPRAVMERLRGRGVTVFCHFGLLRIPLREKLGVPSRFDGTCAVPTDLHRVASDYPELNFQVPHLGAGYLRETLFLGQQCPNVYVDTSSSNAWMKVAVPPLELRTVLRLALDAFGPARLLWGSDSGVFPRGWRRDLYEAQRATLRELGVSEDDQGAIFGGNAARLWNLEKKE